MQLPTMLPGFPGFQDKLTAYVAFWTGYQKCFLGPFICLKFRVRLPGFK